VDDCGHFPPHGKTRRVQFLGGNDLDDPDRSAGVLTYSFDRRLIEILRDSTIWGKIALPHGFHVEIRREPV
jgi:hypothetical protein